jgi:hypothetical protein
MVASTLGPTLQRHGLSEQTTEHDQLFDAVVWENALTKVKVVVDRHDDALDVAISSTATPLEEFPLWLVAWATGTPEIEARERGHVGSYDLAAVKAHLIRAAAILAGPAAPLLAGDFSLVPRLRRANELRIDSNRRHGPWPELGPL